jgi:hypothetical protein
MKPAAPPAAWVFWWGGLQPAVVELRSTGQAEACPTKSAFSNGQEWQRTAAIRIKFSARQPFYSDF